MLQYRNRPYSSKNKLKATEFEILHSQRSDIPQRSQIVLGYSRLEQTNVILRIENGITDVKILEEATEPNNTNNETLRNDININPNITDENKL